MAQGLKKTGGKKTSKAALKKQQSKQLKKGRKAFNAKGRKTALAKQELHTSKAINKKNEAMASARAVNAGNTFSLQDLKENGKKELARLKRNQTKSERKSNDLSSRLKDQLRKMGRDV